MQQQASVAILFADISGSTRLYETVGDASARRNIARCIDLMTEATRSHGGTLIKVIGDEVMCTFPSADDAAAAALEMQEKVSSALITGRGPLMAIHVGFHFGPVIFEEGDVFGDAVNVASRMTNLAKRDQILTTGATIESLSPQYRKATRQVDRASVRGKSEQIDVYEFVWQEEDATRMGRKAWVVPQGGPPGRLVIDGGGRHLEVDESHPSVTVGRADQNDLVINDDMASRLHARIEYRNRRFSLTDQSTNGTYVIDGPGKAHFVRHDTQVLAGKGKISFGRDPELDPANEVAFEVSA